MYTIAANCTCLTRAAPGCPGWQRASPCGHATSYSYGVKPFWHNVWILQTLKETAKLQKQVQWLGSEMRDNFEELLVFVWAY